jgi:hypothetical protein
MRDRMGHCVEMYISDFDFYMSYSKVSPRDMKSKTRTALAFKLTTARPPQSRIVVHIVGIHKVGINN